MTLLEITQKLKEIGYKITPQRKVIIQVLLDASSHQTAKEVYNLVREKYPQIGFDTIYRNLNLLAELGVVNVINFAAGCSRFELDNKVHHHHLVCLGCGQVQELEACPWSKIAPAIMTKSNYKIMGHYFQVYGYCPACQ